MDVAVVVVAGEGQRAAVDDQQAGEAEVAVKGQGAAADGHAAAAAADAAVGSQTRAGGKVEDQGGGSRAADDDVAGQRAGIGQAVADLRAPPALTAVVPA